MIITTIIIITIVIIIILSKDFTVHVLGRFHKCAIENNENIRGFSAATLTFILTPFSLTSSSLDFHLPSHCYPELPDRRDFAFSSSIFQQQLQAHELILKIH